MATANRKSSPTLQPTLVFDEVGQSWLSVAVTASMSPSSASLAPGFRQNCPPGVAVTGEIWEVISLQPRANGTLAGEYTVRSSSNCDNTRTVTFTRVGDVDVNSVPDPASQAPRVVSPAEALRGRYHYAVTARFTTGGTATTKGDYVVRTDCLRTGDRCMSFLHNDKAGDALVFADGAWTENGESDGSCPPGGNFRAKVSGTFPLPKPLQDPIPVLTGNGRMERSPGTACASFDFDMRYERTGD